MRAWAPICPAPLRRPGAALHVALPSVHRSTTDRRRCGPLLLACRFTGTQSCGDCEVFAEYVKDEGERKWGTPSLFSTALLLRPAGDTLP